MQVEISIYDRGGITMSVAANTREQYKATMQKVQELLTQNPEWRNRYAEYIKKLSEIPKQLQEECYIRSQIGLLYNGQV